MLDKVNKLYESVNKKAFNLLPAVSVALFLLLSCGDNTNITLNNDWKWNISATSRDLVIKYIPWSWWMIKDEGWVRYGDSLIECVNKYPFYEKHKNSYKYDKLEWHLQNKQQKNNFQEEIDWFTYFVNAVKNYSDSTTTQNTKIINWDSVKNSNSSCNFKESKKLELNHN